MQGRAALRWTPERSPESPWTEATTSEQGDDPSLRRERVETLTSLGALPARRGVLEEAEATLSSAVALAETCAVPGRWALNAGVPAGALEHFQEAQSLVSKVADAHPSNLMIRHRLATTFTKLGNAHSDLGDDEAALCAY